ncbi:uncharacterized protein [Drosophila bipectinata]|uniref:uncharacterized protein n=1 Tax=Drosophila bipectinata TaxID=42026 RepID=UPI001C89E463|nr:uncharacterized protein LOC108128881 [Drosophila bipectinata]
MGAHNSKPQTVQMPNPIPFHITREVMERIDQSSGNITMSPSNYCEKCKQRERGGASASTDVPPKTMDHKPSEVTVKNPVPVVSPWKRRSSEIEEAHFGQSLQRVQDIFGKPIYWAKECSADITKLEEDLVFCYQKYSNEPLQCAPLASQYHRYVFAKQAAEINRPRKENPNTGDPSKKLHNIEDAKIEST